MSYALEKRNMLEKTKAHISRNKKLYIGVGVGIVLGAGAYYLKTRVTNSAVQTVMAFKTGDVSQNIIQVSMTRPGPKSFVIQCLETQSTYPSLRSAAADLGINPGELSKHLSGKLSEAGGLHFVKLAEI